MERFTQHVGDNMISYLDQGIGDCVVLIHGFCGDHNYWKYIVPHLIKKNRVLTIDLRGHGHSSTPKDTCDITEMADDIAKVLQSLNIQRATLIGHSLGGYISLAFAEKYSDMLSGLALVHSTAYPDSNEAKENRDKGIENIKRSGIVPFVNELIPKLFANENVSELAYHVNEVKKIGYKTSDFGAIGALNAMKNRRDRNDILKNMRIPILLVAGREDNLLPIERVFSTENKMITQVVIENCGHMSMLEQPDILIKAIQDLIHRIEIKR
ncbi:alpha/beta fold hydrolase [Metabacillus malikii]|uniref:Pimeloyl-ACP methyl ester carboxylesterase n=1 Tax=Metabacillus malikii TaxID=1504265 RepID=A0ABT9Z9E3_9BACI|nr:alpha/beta hydrolase [Metabacillus malikii]MDQ0228881.1 pimeloyl-ACP methyl ester carboxylesterase [Metabacillus malikii]